VKHPLRIFAAGFLLRGDGRRGVEDARADDCREGTRHCSGAPEACRPYYFSKEWKELSRQAMERDGYMCTVPGCGKRAKVPDHIVPRRWGGADTLGNIRCLCDDHDRKFKERPNGSRKKMAMGRGFEKPKAAL
jgi:5-methylcytosine-specific restriction endonuclease McrA